MLRSPGSRIGLGVAAWLVLISVLHLKPWRSSVAHAGASLEVGFLPVT
jgi:hypothetical protein